MTAAHVASLSAHAAIKPAASTSTPEPPGSAPFRQRLHDARTQGGSPAPAAHEARPQRGPDPARDRRNDPSPLGPHARPSSPAPAAARLERTGTNDATPSAQAADAAAAAPPPAATGVPVPEAAVDAVLAEPADGKSGEHEEEGATALVEAMLALIGPAPVRHAATAAAAVDATAAPLVTTPAALVAQAQAGAPAVDLAAIAAVVTPAVAELSTRDPDAARDMARLDAAASVAPTVTHVTVAPAPSTAPVPVAPAHVFAQELGQQIAWFTGHDVKQARIRLHPEELGSLDLKISVQHNRVDVVMHAQHPGAVAAVQQALPQLDQMLARHGLSLGHADVGQHDGGDQANRHGHGQEVSAVDEATGPAHITPLAQLGLVDAFA